MTLGALAGEKGHQWSEWQRVLTWIKTEIQPDIISLSNGLLMGLCPAIKRDLDIPVIVSLQGEDSFLDTLIDPYREQCWEAMEANATHVTRFVTASRYYGDLMRNRLNIPEDKMSLAYNGLELTAFAAAKPDPNWNTIGYFARMIHGKGLTTLVDAYLSPVLRRYVDQFTAALGGAARPCTASGWVGESWNDARRRPWTGPSSSSRPPQPWTWPPPCQRSTSPGSARCRANPRR